MDEAAGRRGFGIGSRDDLSAFLLTCLADGEGGVGRHVDLDGGDDDSPACATALYRVLGIQDETPVLCGISQLDTGDIEACREEWGEPLYRVDLGAQLAPGLRWDFWRLSGLTLGAESVAAASVVLVEADPRWVLLTGASDSDPMLFAGPGECPAHRLDRLSVRPPRAY